MVDYETVKNLSDDDVHKRYFEGHPDSEWSKALKVESEWRLARQMSMSASRIETTTGKVSDHVEVLKKSSLRIEKLNGILIFLTAVLALDVMLRLIHEISAILNAKL